MSLKQKVDIALATYQGGAFLAEQLASLLAQTHRINQVVVRDDGSSDGTVELIESVSDRGLTVRVISDDAQRLGPSGNFSKVLAATQAPYVALCDQDDVWDKDKVEHMLVAMREAESSTTIPLPVLVCSDLRLVDHSARPLAASYWRHQGYDAARAVHLASLLVMNCFPGCSMLANRALLDLALPIPPAAVMHDWWIALVAAATGRIVPLRKSLISYRIHPNNAIGIPKRSISASPMDFQRATSLGVRSAFAAALLQAKELQERLANSLPQHHSDMLRSFCRIDKQGWVGRRWTLLGNGIGKHGMLRQINLLIHV
jgi:glycosyltransferase involved in cell wall biosynthesis